MTQSLVLFSVAAALAGPGKALTPAQKELRLIQSKRDIENPTIVVEAAPFICRTFTVTDTHTDTHQM